MKNKLAIAALTGALAAGSVSACTSTSGKYDGYPYGSSAKAGNKNSCKSANSCESNSCKSNSCKSNSCESNSCKH